MHTDHERRISYIEGKLESLATKELVMQSHANLLAEIRSMKDELNNKIDQQTKELRTEINGLDERINTQDKKYTKLAGAAVAIGLILSLVVGAANAFATAVSAGLLQIG